MAKHSRKSDNIYEHVSSLNKPLAIEQIKRSSIKRAKKVLHEDRDLAQALLILQAGAEKVTRLQGKQ